jgi:sigma-E factor negative regulatory protein RseA
MGSVSMQSQECSRGERLSALVDGEWFGESDPANGLLSEFDSADRAMWSEYHLIGDALRSDELAIKPSESHAFLAGFAARLETEPHVLAPSWRSPAQLLRRRVVPALAVAAAAATLSWVIIPQMHVDGTSGAMQMAAAGRQDNVQTVAAVSTPAAQQPDVNIIRDASLDQYLEAHQQFAQAPMVSVSMPLIRAAALTTQGR